MKRLTAALLPACMLTALQSCFTGIESTPKIGASELKRQHVSVTPEQEFLSGVASQHPSQWQSGKEFVVTDSKISLIFTSASTGTDSLQGQVLRFCRFDSVPAVDTHAATEVVLTHGNDTLRYRPGFAIEELPTRSRLDLPFTIDLDPVNSVRPLLIGNTYYITTPLWYTPATLQAEAGLRHVPVTVTDIRPGTEAMPILVVFDYQTDSGTTKQSSVLMTIGSERQATRNFHTLFAFENPRKRYNTISDEVWQLIIHSKVREGMTRDECRLALGAPLQIDHGNSSASTLERWSYPDGVFLIFDDGVLSRYRL